MGKQVNFYLTPSDLVDVEALINTIEPCYILHSRSKSNEPLVIESFTMKEKGNDWWDFYLVRQCDILDVKMEEVPSQGYWSIDGMQSPVIKFNKCPFDGFTLGRGRIYFNEKYYGANASLTYKPDAFKVWANTILRRVKKKLLKKDDFYWGEEANRLSLDPRYKIND